ncbi:MAG TPA: hypothetical protein PLU10_10650, partial [Chitinophagaceae bacterium]|nr:hypothetical protein [Chitinophagaceae bacterium]
VCNINISCHKLGNKARNVRKSGALHTPSLRLDFFAPRFVSRQKVEKENKIKPPLVQASRCRHDNKNITDDFEIKF